MKIRDLAWGDFEGWAALYYSRYDELSENPQLGVFTTEPRPSLGEESALFGSVWKRILSGDVVASVAEDAGTLVGHCSVARLPHVEDRHVGTLGIAVQPGRRGQGIGTELMLHVLAKCDGRFEIVRLAVLSVNEPALRLYRRLGFVERGRIPRTFRRGGVDYDEVLMSQELAGPAASRTSSGSGAPCRGETKP